LASTFRFLKSANFTKNIATNNKFCRFYHPKLSACYGKYASKNFAAKSAIYLSKSANLSKFHQKSIFTS